MIKIITAMFDGNVLRPDEPLDLKLNARYRVIIEAEPVEKLAGSAPGGDADHPRISESALVDERTGNVWDLLERLVGTVEAPPDWSLRHDPESSDTPRNHSDPQDEE